MDSLDFRFSTAQCNDRPVSLAEIANGEILTVDEILRRVERVSLDDARRIAHRVLSQPMTLTVLGPVTPSSFAGALV